MNHKAITSNFFFYLYAALLLTLVVGFNLALIASHQPHWLVLLDNAIIASFIVHLYLARKEKLRLVERLVLSLHGILASVILYGLV